MVATVKPDSKATTHKTTYMTIYINGVDCSSGIYGDFKMTDKKRTHYIGRSYSHKEYGFNGKIKNFYLYPEPCMFGSKSSKYINAAVDISDGFYGDLQKILHGKFGAKIFNLVHKLLIFGH